MFIFLYIFMYKEKPEMYIFLKFSRTFRGIAPEHQQGGHPFLKPKFQDISRTFSRHFSYFSRTVVFMSKPRHSVTKGQYF